jgi:hypothetical protein
MMKLIGTLIRYCMGIKLPQYRELSAKQLGDKQYEEYYNICKEGNIEKFDAFVKKYKVKMQVEDPMCLSLAIETDNIPFIKHLCTKYPQFLGEQIAIFCSLTIRHKTDVLDALLELGMDINIDNGTLLQTAAEFGDLEWVKYLIEKGAKVELDDYITIDLCAMDGQTIILKYFMEICDPPREVIKRAITEAESCNQDEKNSEAIQYLKRVISLQEINA